MTVPLNFNNCFVGFYSITGIKCKNNTINPSITRNIHIKATPTVYLLPVATLGKMIITELGSVIYIQRDGIITHDSFATQVTNNGLIYWQGGNTNLAIDGTSANPAYSFQTGENLGLYKYSFTVVGASGNLLLSNNGAALNMGVNNASNNPSINFFTSNTGSYNTASSRIQAYGGTGSASSGTIEFNAAVLQSTTGFTGNKTTSFGAWSFTNLVGCTGLAVQNAIAVREGSFNRLYLIITGTLTASDFGSFTINLFERTSNWSTAYQLWGTGSCVNAPPGNLEISGVLCQSRSGTALMDVAFGGFNSSTSDAFQISLECYYQRL